MADSAKVDKLKLLLGISGGKSDALVEFALDSVEETVKNYCHIDSVPEGLSATVLRMAMELYRNEQPGEGSVPQAVKSIGAGDTSTSFGNVETTGYSETLLKNYKSQLNRYRKVVRRNDRRCNKTGTENT